MNAVWHAVVAANLSVALLGGGLAAPVAQAQQAAPAPAPVPVPAPAPTPALMVDPAAEAAALQELSQQLQARRSELEVQRRALREERARISAVDRPASAEQLAQWRDRDATGRRLRHRVAMLERLLAALTPEALQAISPPGDTMYEFLTSDVGLKSTSLEVALRDAPEGAVTIVLPLDTLVVQVAADAGGAWSVVVAAGGSGYVPTPMLKSAD